MAHDWLLVETLGGDPTVVAQGRQLKNLVPITTFLRRSPYLSAVRTAIAESVQTGQALTSITPKRDRVIRTEPVVMSDGSSTACTCGPGRRTSSRRSGRFPGR